VEPPFDVAGFLTAHRTPILDSAGTEVASRLAALFASTPTHTLRLDELFRGTAAGPI
jgi:hypothetical protein